MKIQIEIILFWGSLWGIEEATLGHVLHLLPVNIGWLFWFPLAYLFMFLSYQKTHHITSILWTSVIAASIKLIDLLLPIRIDKVINPTVSILLEGAAVFLLIKVMNSRTSASKYFFVIPFASSLLYQLFYIIYISIVPLFFTAIPAAAGISAYLDYGLHGMVNGILLVVISACCVQVINRKGKGQQTVRPSMQFSVLLTVLSYLLPAIALFVQWKM